MHNFFHRGSADSPSAVAAERVEAAGDALVGGQEVPVPVWGAVPRPWPDRGSSALSASRLPRVTPPISRLHLGLQSDMRSLGLKAKKKPSANGFSVPFFVKNMVY